ncbi:MAG: protease modulator HflK [Sphingomonas sp.]
MVKRFGWPSWAGVFKNEPPKSPWGSGGGKGDGEGGSGGPRNPWSLPPGGKRSPSGGGPLDELLRRARRGGSGFPGLPTGPGLWLAVLGGLLLIWVAATSIHSITQAERGVVSTLGRYSDTLEPGVRVTLPAPFTTVQTVDVQNFRIENFPENGGENLMLTGDRAIVDMAYQVQWNVQSAPDFTFQIKDPKDTIRATAETAMRAVVATASLNDAIGVGRTRIQAQVQIAMQQILDDYHSGIRIQSVSIQKAIYPQAVDDAFKQVTAAQQGAESAKNTARGYAQQVIAAAQGETTEFDKIYEQYKLAPEVTRQRLYFETMEAVLARSNKVVLEAPGVTPYLPLPALRRDDDADKTPDAGTPR